MPSGPSGRFDFGDEQLKNTQLQLTDDDPLLEDAVSAACNVRIVVMNPPFTNRSKMGEKFHKDDQRALRKQVDELEQRLVAADPDLKDFVGKNSIGGLFEGLADKCVDLEDGVCAMIGPTISLTGASQKEKRKILAKRFHVHTLLTSHQPGQVNLSQHTAINESMIILRRCKGNKPPTRIINLDRMPLDEGEAATLHQVLQNTTNSGLLSDGWGEVSEWPEERIAQGDWSAAVFRSPVLAEAAYEIAHNERLRSIKSQAIIPSAVLGGGAQMRPLRKSTADTPDSFPVLYSKSEDAQKTICARPDRYLISTKDARDAGAYGEVENTATQKLLRHAGYLLVTAGQDTSTARLSAVANEASYLGSGGWHPVPGLGAKQAKALAVFLNSTAGRIQLLGNSGKKLSFPKYNPGAYEDIRVPDLDDESTITKLATCWEHTFDMVVPQYRDGECEVRQLWDYAVAEALGWDRVWLDDLRQQLHDEPHVRGLGRDQYGDSESGIIKTNFQTLIHPTLPHGDTTHSMAGPNVQTTRRATPTCPVNSTRNHNL